MDADYERNIQIADLNALTASMAVIRWKKFSGFYQDLEWGIAGDPITTDVVKAIYGAGKN